MSFFRRPPTSKKPIVRDLRPHKWLLIIMGPVFSLVVASLSSLNAEERVALFLVQAVAILMIVAYLPDETHEEEAPPQQSTRPTESTSPFRRPSTPLPPPRPFEGSRFSAFSRPPSESESTPNPFRSRFTPKPDEPSETNDDSPFRRGRSPFGHKPEDDSTEERSRFTFGKRSSEEGEDKPTSPFRRKTDDNVGSTEDMGSVFKRYFDELSDDDDDKNEDIPF